MFAPPLLAVLVATAAPPARSCYLEPSALSAELRPLLGDEIGREARTDKRAEAQFFLTLAAIDRSLELEVRNVRGERILFRRIATNDDKRPALRLAVLAIEEAIDAELALARRLAEQKRESGREPKSGAT